MVNLVKKLLKKINSKREIQKYINSRKFKHLQHETNLKINENLNKINYYKDNYIEKFFFKNFNNQDEIITQYILNNINWKNLQKKIIIGKYKAVSLPANLSFLKNLSINIKINFFLSFVTFYLFVIKSFLFGVIYYFWKIITFFIDKKNYQTAIRDSSFFLGINKNCINDDFSNDLNTYGLSDWFFKDFNQEKNKSFFFHNCKDKKKTKNPKFFFISSPINIIKVKTLLYFVFFGFFLILFSLIHLLLFKWKLPLFLKELLSSNIIRNTPDEFLSKNYFFNNSSWVFRPLWTYEAEKKNSNVIMFFYASNIESIKKDDENTLKPINFYSLMTWKNYYVWDNHHENTLKSFLKQKNYSHDSIFKLVGPIPFEDKPLNFGLKNEHINIVIFDIPLYRRADSYYFDFETSFYTYENIKKFYFDILEIFNEKDLKNVKLFLKTKRSINTNIHDKRYKKLISKLSNSIEIIDPRVSAIKLAKNFDACISLPFTSTSRIFDNLGKKAVYFDPVGYFKKKHKAAKNIQILNNDELKNWVFKIKNEIKQK